ncbi:MAG TPA: hypothetical protein VFQ53_25905 [Kofleriaceae bacterium]|nr:hypothetical protein [Kofleriaceae bacterium]
MANEDPTPEPTTAALFALMWNDLVDVLGSSATATLVRRAAKHAARVHPRLQQLVIQRPAFEYEYVVPSEWLDDLQGRDALIVLVQTLRPLLEELTGPIVIRRLSAIPELARTGVLGANEPTREDA